MQTHFKSGVISLTVAMALMAGCAPVPSTDTQAGAVTDAYGTTTVPAAYSGTYGTNSAAPASDSYSYYNASPANGGYDTYANTTAGANTGSSTSYYDYSAPGSSGSGSSYSAGSSGSASGSHAVQVVASPNRGTAESMQRQMQSQGFSAVIDQVGGYYKVRIPFTTESEAKATLSRVRSSVPDAFYTVR